jgi:hypothetical protein
MKQDLLYEAGIAALTEGQHRDAAFNFAAAYERYLEYSLKVLLIFKNKSFNKEEFKIVWKQLSKQSERQYGAFWMLYFNVFNQAPPAFDKKFLDSRGIKLGIEGNDPVNFRNIVTHQGYTPSYNQAVSYGEAVWQYIAELMRLGREFSPDYNGAMFYAADNNTYHEIKADYSLITKGLGMQGIITFLYSSNGIVPDLNKSLFDLFPLKK